MIDIWLKKELLAYIENERRAGRLGIYEFLKDLSLELKNDVEELLEDEKKMENMVKEINDKRLSLSPIYMILENQIFPSRWVATTLSEILEVTGPSLIVSHLDEIGFEVYLLQKEDPLLSRNSPMVLKAPFKASVMGLGDVGGTLLMGLRLLASPTLEEIKIYDRDEKKRRRYYLEINEISDGGVMPPIIEADLSTIFDTDVFIFTVSAHIPPLGTTLEDVRLVQFEKNKQILLDYVKQGESSGFQGYYFIVSDPVDLLCMAVVEEGHIPPHRVKGFGLGVMEARARFIAKEKNVFKEDLRTFGPHGKGLIVINSLSSYNDALSQELTALTEKENFRVRETGFKPYIAPALSSGAISIIKALKGEEHLSTIFNGHVFMGTRSVLSHGFTWPTKVSLMELTPLLMETQALLESLYEANKQESP